MKDSIKHIIDNKLKSEAKIKSYFSQQSTQWIMNVITDNKSMKEEEGEGRGREGEGGERRVERLEKRRGTGVERESLARRCFIFFSTNPLLSSSFQVGCCKINSVA